MKGILENGIRIFRGITYARYERFSEAVLQPLGDADDATRYGTICPQRSNRLASIIGEDKGSVIEEGSLCLSIYAPEHAENLPVMVWLHGGAFVTGGSEEKRYGCERLVETGNVVAVKISYRLGALGYLWMPEKGVTNLGLKDQILALEWVHANIASFGGDPSNVTIFGQSAGAMSIAAIIAQSGRTPLFRKCILQSAPLGITLKADEAEKITKIFLDRLGKDPMTASLDEILDVQESMMSLRTGLTFMPVLEGMTSMPISAKDLNIVVGYTAQDISPFLKGALGKLFPTFIGRAVVSFANKMVFAKPSNDYISRLKANGAKVDGYFISWHPEGNELGSCHCIELPFLLGQFDDWKEAKMLQGITEEEYYTNSADVLNVWTGFAQRGEFTHKGIIERIS